MTKRKAVLKKLRKAAKAHGLSYQEMELTNHTGITVGKTASTLGRHSEVDQVTEGKFYDQFANELGKGWWR
jgi:hypothetical protein